MSDRRVICQRFWQELLPKAMERTQLHASASAHKECRVGAPAGLGNISFVYVLKQDKAQVELFRRGDESETDDQRYGAYDALSKRMDEIEEAVNGALIWKRAAGKWNWHISKEIAEGGYLDQERWPDIQDVMISEMIAFEKALRPFLREIAASQASS